MWADCYRLMIFWWRYSNNGNLLHDYILTSGWISRGYVCLFICVRCFLARHFEIWLFYCSVRLKMAADIVLVHAIIHLQETVLGTKREWPLFCISLLASANYCRFAMTSTKFIESVNWIIIIIIVQLAKRFLISPLCCDNIPMSRRLAPALALIFYHDFISPR